MNALLNKAREDTGRLTNVSLSDFNNMKIMVQSGSKGSEINISQVSISLLLAWLLYIYSGPVDYRVIGYEFDICKNYTLIILNTFHRFYSYSFWSSYNLYIVSFSPFVTNANLYA